MEAVILFNYIDYNVQLKSHFKMYKGSYLEKQCKI